MRGDFTFVLFVYVLVINVIPSIAPVATTPEATTPEATTPEDTTPADTTPSPTAEPLEGCEKFRHIFRKKLNCLEKTVKKNGRKLDKSYNFKVRTLTEMLQRSQQSLMSMYNDQFRQIAWRYLYKTGCNYESHSGPKKSADCSLYRRLYQRKRHLLAKIYDKKNRQVNIQFHMKMAKLSQILLTKRNKLQEILIEKQRDLEREILFKNGCEFDYSCSSNNMPRRMFGKCSCGKKWLREVPFGFFDFGSFSVSDSWSKSDRHHKKRYSSTSKSYKKRSSSSRSVRSSSSCSKSHRK